MPDATAGVTVCFGEILLRLSSPRPTQLFQTASLDANFVGAEANVAVALARFGRKARIVSTVPDNAIGDAAIEAMRRHGADTSGIRRDSGRLGIFYLNVGAGLRASTITYDRDDSVFVDAAPDSYDWADLLSGASRLHLSGITPALGPKGVALSLAAVEAARRANVPISFDGNFRPSLWERWCPDPRAILYQFVDAADLLFGNHRDISLVLGKDFSGDDEDRRREAAMATFMQFPRLQHIASTARRVENTDRQHLSARVESRVAVARTHEVLLTGIVDRIGTGDAFAAGVIAGLDEGEERAAELGLAIGALKHFTLGDASLSDPDDVEAFLSGSRDVQR